jgi:uncharacterized protein YndB with AHSA1/START domain
MNNKEKITVKTKVKKQVDKVWEFWTKPEHITQWNFATDEWCCPVAKNDLKVGGKFSYKMEAKDGSIGFEYWGIYNTVKENKLLEINLGDHRKVKVEFLAEGDQTSIHETFEVEDTNTVEMQRLGWQAILDNFKKYTESIIS